MLLNLGTETAQQRFLLRIRENNISIPHCSSVCKNEKLPNMKIAESIPTISLNFREIILVMKAISRNFRKKLDSNFFNFSTVYKLPFNVND